jgi:hypothetical protein
MADHIQRKINKEWVIEQLDAAGVRSPLVRAEVGRILDAYESIGTTVDPEVAEEGMRLASELALGHALVSIVEEDEVWVDAVPGQIKRADEVRVKLNAFEGKTGQIHNGRRGKVVDLRSGDVIFKSTDNKNPLLDGVHYSAYNLEKRIK